MVFGDLSQDRVRNTEFDWDKILSFEGDSGPYVQYTIVRCRSLLRKFGAEVTWNFKRELNDPAEIKLMTSLLQLDHIFAVAFRTFKPNLLAQYLLELCGDFSQFYQRCRVLDEDLDVTRSRMALVSATEKVLVKGLEVLNIESPEVM